MIQLSPGEVLSSLIDAMAAAGVIDDHTAAEEIDAVVSFLTPTLNTKLANKQR